MSRDPSSKEGSERTSTPEPHVVSRPIPPMSADRRKPLKKRRIQWDDDSSFDDTSIMPAPKLQRQVASCWRQQGSKAGGAASVRARQEDIAWREITKLPPTSGPYSYSDRYSSAIKPIQRPPVTKKKPKGRPSLIEDEDFDEEANSTAPAKLPATTRGIPAAATSNPKEISSSDGVPFSDSVLLDDGDLEQELHMLTLQSYHNKKDKAHMTHLPNAGKGPASKITVTPPPIQEWSFAPIQQSHSKASESPGSEDDFCTIKMEKKSTSPRRVSGDNHLYSHKTRAFPPKPQQTSAVVVRPLPTPKRRGKVLKIATAMTNNSALQVPEHLHTTSNLDDVMRETLYPTPDCSPATSPERPRRPTQSSAPETPAASLRSSVSAPAGYYKFPPRSFNPQQGNAPAPMFTKEKSSEIHHCGYTGMRHWRHSLPGRAVTPKEDHPLFSPIQSGRSSSAFAPGLRKLRVAYKDDDSHTTA